MPKPQESFAGASRRARGHQTSLRPNRADKPPVERNQERFRSRNRIPSLAWSTLQKPKFTDPCCTGTRTSGSRFVGVALSAPHTSLAAVALAESTRQRVGSGSTARLVVTSCGRLIAPLLLLRPDLVARAPDRADSSIDDISTSDDVPWGR